MTPLKLHVSKGNVKMGTIPSISLTPIVTCPKGAGCFAKCYAKRLENFRKGMRDNDAENLELYRSNPAEFWAQAEKAIAASRFFRWHVSGDIPEPAYFEKIVKLFRKYPGTEGFIFTKQYKFVNEVVAKLRKQHRGIPANLHVWFSEWLNFPMDNPNNFSVAYVRFKPRKKGEPPKTNAPATAHQCTGGCLSCALSGTGCFSPGRGHSVVFDEH